MSDPSPDFQALLGPFLARFDPVLRPRFLAALERGAASRYRTWAEQAPHHAETLHACAEREEEIARAAEERFPADAAARGRIAEALLDAGPVYDALFTDLSLGEQWRVQAAAERAGARAWRALGSEQDDAEVREALLRCAGLEEESALALDKLVAEEG